MATRFELKQKYNKKVGKLKINENEGNGGFLLQSSTTLGKMHKLQNGLRNAMASKTQMKVNYPVSSGAIGSQERMGDLHKMHKYYNQKQTSHTGDIDNEPKTPRSPMNGKSGGRRTRGTRNQMKSQTMNNLNMSNNMK